MADWMLLVIAGVLIALLAHWTIGLVLIALGAVLALVPHARR